MVQRALVIFLGKNIFRQVPDIQELCVVSGPMTGIVHYENAICSGFQGGLQQRKGFFQVLLGLFALFNFFLQTGDSLG